MKTLRQTSRHALLALLLGAGLVGGGAACDSTKVQLAGGGGGMSAAAGGANGAAGGANGAAGGANGGLGGAGVGAAGGATGAGGAIALVDWVTDLADNHTNDVSAPDTVEDKNIIDTVDPAAFDPLLLRH